MIRSLFSLAVFLCFSFMLTAQDIHYSQFFNSPLNLNPGLTGVFNGNQRYHFDYKSQWQAVPVGYETFTIGADWKFFKQGKPNFFSAGLLLNRDQAGDLGLSHTGIGLFGSYSLKMGARSYLTPGVNVGYVARNVDYSAAQTTTSNGGGAIDPLASANETSLSFIDVNAGLNYRWQRDFRKFLDLGVDLFHLNSPTERVSNTVVVTSNRPIKMNLYGMANWQLASKIDLLLNALYSRQSTYNETVLNAQGKLYLGNAQNTALYLGLGARLGDSWWPMIAIEHNNIYASFNFDFTTSEFDWANDGKGGPEFHLRYILAKVPSTLYKPCPIY